MNRRSFLTLAAAASIPPMAVVAVTHQTPEARLDSLLEEVMECMKEIAPGAYIVIKNISVRHISIVAAD